MKEKLFFWRNSKELKSYEENIGRDYLRDLNFTWGNLQGKHVLDLGSAGGAFGLAAKKRDISVVSVDKQAETPFKEIPFIKADALALPLDEDTFDTVVAHDSIKYMVLTLTPGFQIFEKHKKYTSTKTGAERLTEETTEETVKEKFRTLFSEVKRVMKPGGEFRFDTHVWAPLLYVLTHPLSTETPKQEDIMQNAYKFLLDIEPTISLEETKDPETNEIFFYFNLKKTSDKKL